MILLYRTIRDQQRQKVYTWEREVWEIDSKLTKKLTLEECQELVNLAYFRYRPNALRTPRVTDGRGTRRAMAYGISKISLPLWARSPGVVLHEVAHTLTNNSSYAVHGPEFVRVMCDLWKWHCGVSYVSSAKKSKVRVSPANKVLAPIRIRQGRVDVAIAALLRLSPHEYNRATSAYKSKINENLMKESSNGK